jgi:hypothetical protein
VVAILENFDDYWSLDNLDLKAGFDDFLPLDDAAVSITDFFSLYSHINDYQLSEMAQSFEGTYYAGGMQQQQSFGVGDQYIDPALLGQPQSTPPRDPTLQSTPGLTAVPREVSLVPILPVQPAQVENVYPDPSVADPYLYPSGYQPLSYVPRPSAQYAQYVAPSNLAPPVKVRKRARSESDSESDVPARNVRRSTQPARNESEDESDGIVAYKTSRERQTKRFRRESGDSGVLSNSSLDKPNLDKVARVGQKPQKCDDKPWVRINTATKGETTRTARINGEAAQVRKYKSKPLPHGNWESQKYTFEYVSHNGLDEFKNKRMSPRQITEYITQYPSDDLTLWLQVSPADMARRYGSQGHSKCLFRDCPKHIYGDSGTIDVGHYRVAFDEKFSKYGNKVVDPFDCSGFVHLYCLERFCDFEYICCEANIRVDTRVDLPREAGQAKWTMSGRPEAELAQYFLKACRRNQLRTTDPFKAYPVHQSSSTPKAFDGTLAHALADVNIEHRTRSQISQFVKRKLTPNVFMISKGDMEVAMTQKKIKRSKVYKKATRGGRAAQFDFTAYYDEYDPIINTRIARYKAIEEQFAKEDASGVVPRKSKAKGTSASTKRKYIAVHASSSDSEPDYNDDGDSDLEELSGPPHIAAAQPGTRSSPRKRTRVNYSLDDLGAPVEQQQQYQYPPQPLPSIAAPQGAYIPQGYTAPLIPRTPSLSALFPRDGTLNIDDYIDPSTTTDHRPFNQSEFDALMNSYLERRKSSTLSEGPTALYAGIMKSSMSRSPRQTRQASFNVQPVSQKTVFARDDPPSRVAVRRRSERLPSKSG